MASYTKQPKEVFRGSPVSASHNPDPVDAQVLLDEVIANIAAAEAAATELDPCAVRTIANITLSGEQTLDGVLTSADRVLVMVQTDATENGVYVSAAGAWSRATDADTSAEIANAHVHVIQGTTHAGTRWKVAGSPVLGTDDIDWLTAPYAPSTTDALTEGSTNLYASQDNIETALDADFTDAGAGATKDSGGNYAETIRRGVNPAKDSGKDLVLSAPARRRLYIPGRLGETWALFNYEQSNGGYTDSGAPIVINSARGAVRMPADGGGFPGFGDGLYKEGGTASTFGIRQFRTPDQNVNPKVSGPLQTRAAPTAVALARLWEDDLPTIVAYSAGRSSVSITGASTSLHLDGGAAKTDTYNRMIQTVQDIYDNATEPLTRVLIDFGATPEQDQADSEAVYTAKMQAFITDVEADIAAISASITVDWFLSSASGNTSDGDWGTRLSPKVVADADANAYYVGNRAPLGLYDLTHLENYSQVLFGEQTAACMHDAIRGYGWTWPTISTSISLPSDTVLLRMAGPDPVEVQERYPCGPLKGFAITDGGAPLVTAVADPVLQPITATGAGVETEISITTASNITATGTPTLSHGYCDRTTFGDSAADGYAYAQPSLRLANWQMQSMFLPGRTIYRYLAPFTEAL